MYDTPGLPYLQRAAALGRGLRCVLQWRARRNLPAFPAVSLHCYDVQRAGTLPPAVVERHLHRFKLFRASPASSLETEYTWARAKPYSPLTVKGHYQPHDMKPDMVCSGLALPLVSVGAHALLHCFKPCFKLLL